MGDKPVNPTIHALPFEQERNYGTSSLTSVPTARTYMEYIVQEVELDNLSTLNGESVFFFSVGFLLGGFCWDVLRANYRGLDENAWQYVFTNDVAWLYILATALCIGYAVWKQYKRFSLVRKIKRESKPITSDTIRR